MDHLADGRGALIKPKDRAEHVRLIMELMGLDEDQASFVVSIERGESAGDVFIAGVKNDPTVECRPAAAVREPTPAGRS